jgi:glycosyltransferase involved in cell wall biosynthesis
MLDTVDDTDRAGPVVIAIICPVYNEATNVSYFAERVRTVRDALDQARYSCFVVFTNNRSSDGTLSKILEIEALYDWVYHVTLSRNMGYQLSVLCGLSIADADLYMVCDVDCEDPPEMLTQFLQHIESGRDIVYGIRNNRPDSPVMALCRRGFYGLLRFAGDFTLVPYMAEFAMFRRAVRDVVIQGHNTFPFVRTEVAYAGFDRLGLPYRRDRRRHGRTHYNYLQSLRFATSGLLTSTTLPLRLAFYALPLFTIANLSLLFFVEVGRMGFEAAITAMIGLNSIYLTTVAGFVAVYVARIYHNSLGRKRFTVDRRLSRLPNRIGAPQSHGEAARRLLPSYLGEGSE